MTRPSDPTVEAVPLSAEELADPAFRSWAASHTSGMHWGCVSSGGDGCIVRRLLATLDRSTVPDEGALRAALEAIERDWLDVLPPAGHPIVHGIFQRLPAMLAPLVRAAVTPKDEPDAPLDHALHFDPDCEECVYLARPTVVKVPTEDSPHG